MTFQPRRIVVLYEKTPVDTRDNERGRLVPVRPVMCPDCDVQIPPDPHGLGYRCPLCDVAQIREEALPMARCACGELFYVDARGQRFCLVCDDRRFSVLCAKRERRHRICMEFKKHSARKS